MEKVEDRMKINVKHVNANTYSLLKTITKRRQNGPKQINAFDVTSDEYGMKIIV